MAEAEEMEEAGEMEGRKMGYEPHPIDLSGIELGPELEGAMEAIAKNIHETWARQRAQAGWTYGGVHDYEAKKHPSMVEYEELPESEKDMDRATVLQTIKMLLWMGYRIEKP